MLTSESLVVGSLFLRRLREVVPCCTLKQSEKLSIPIEVECSLTFLNVPVDPFLSYFRLASVSSIAISALSLLVCVSAIIICGLLIPRYEMILSVPNTKIAPNKKPPATGTKANSPCAPYVPDFSANSIAGASSDQNDAAIMTPAAKPSAMSNDFR